MLVFCKTGVSLTNVALLLGNNKIACTFIFELTPSPILKNFFYILLLAGLFSGCQGEEEPLDFINYSIERYFEDCQPESGNCTFISLNYPVATTNTQVAKNINEHIRQHLEEIVDFTEEAGIDSVEELAEGFIKNYERAVADFPESETPWEASVYGEVIFFTEKLISVKFDSDIFSGGAHGYSSTTFLNFDPETGDILTQEELFEEEFIVFVEKEFRQEQEIPSGQPINSTGLFFEDDRFQLPANIGFTEQKVVLHYNAYEIASYAEGSFSMEFSHEEVEDYLKIELQKLESSL